MSSFYFGPPELRKSWELQVHTPVGDRCGDCDELIEDGQAGTIETFIRDLENATPEEASGILKPVHYECGLRRVIGSLGHLRGRCSCFGGNEEDPPGVSRREAAVMAVAYWETVKRHEPI